MSSILIKKNYLNKIKLLNKYNKFYYDKCHPIVSDQKYDDLNHYSLVYLLSKDLCCIAMQPAQLS